MIRLLSSLVLAITRWLFIIVVATALLLVGFIAYKGTQPMGISNADDITYWQFVKERVGIIREQTAKCQQMHFVGFATAVPFYPVLYTYVGLYPDSFIARHTMPHEAIPENIEWGEALNTWWSLVEIVSWEAWATPHLPTVLPECSLAPPTNR